MVIFAFLLMSGRVQKTASAERSIDWPFKTIEDKKRPRGYCRAVFLIDC